MAYVNSDTVAKKLRTDTSVDRVVQPYQSEGRRRVAYGAATLNNAAINDVVRLAWVPFGARILGGKLATGAQLGANVLLSVGIEPVSNAAAANYVLFSAAVAGAGTAQIPFPSAALDRLNTPYEVTDKAGVWVCAQVTNTNTVATDQVVKGYVEYVKD